MTLGLRRNSYTRIANIKKFTWLQTLRLDRLTLIVLANINLRSRSLYVVVRLSVVCNGRAPYLAVEIFSSVSTPLVYWPSIVIQVKFYGDNPRGPCPSGMGLNARCVAEYSNFRPIKGYNSETVQDRR